MNKLEQIESIQYHKMLTLGKFDFETQPNKWQDLILFYFLLY